MNGTADSHPVALWNKFDDSVLTLDVEENNVLESVMPSIYS